MPTNKSAEANDTSRTLVNVRIRRYTAMLKTTKILPTIVVIIKSTRIIATATSLIPIQINVLDVEFELGPVIALESAEFPAQSIDLESEFNEVPHPLLNQIDVVDADGMFIRSEYIYR